ncbi:MAG TPA: class I mannose-6-phosphate isomerase [Gaiellaceae bacterium]|nr:class I mannose-6-phosphate isomerase [Gaiellaceae bacterium]
MRPLELAPNLLRRFYRGGPRIAAFRGLASSRDDTPEDWVGSTTSASRSGDVGLSRVDGRLLKGLVEAEPEAFLGPDHVEERGADPAILVKLLDAGQRLPVHLHPDDDFARARLGERYGKTEAWMILAADAGASVHVGFARDVGEDELRALVAAQDVDAIMALMNERPVAAGDAIYVPAGLAHVIGGGILLLEIQEPSDLGLLLEWRGRVPEDDAFLGLPPGDALRCVTRTALDDAALERLTSMRERRYFPDEADAFFRADRLSGGSELEPSFSILVIVDGEGALETEHADPVPVRRGSTWLVPHAAGTARLGGACAAIACRPSAPARRSDRRP